MQILLSPSKKLDEASSISVPETTQPQLLNEAVTLSKKLKKFDQDAIKDLMGLSDKLAALNFERYQTFTTPFDTKNARPALITFKGDVYDSMDVENYSADDFNFAQDHVRILSGLYGVLRPLDLMQPYRLEMGTKLNNERGSNLYQFWGEQITDVINKSAGPIINLASNEYFKSVVVKALKAPLITIHFKEDKGGKIKTIGLMAKRARGAMADYAIKNRITQPEELKAFNENGYNFEPSLSKDKDWVFVAKR